MKKLIVISFLFLLRSELKAQQYLTYDTIHRHELSISISPLLVGLIGSGYNSSTTNFNLSYKYYFKSRYVFRSALVFFPKANTDFYSGLTQYDRTVNNVNVFRTYYSGNRPKFQLNLGLEKVVKLNRLIHGFGADIGLNYQVIHRSENYTYKPFTFSQNNFMPYDTTNYAIDSLGYTYNAKNFGIALQVFYSLRYKISKHWYVSATVGPSVNVSYGKGSNYDRRTKEVYDIRTFNMDFPNVPLISDISICFRL